MHLQELHIVNFRNILQAELELSPGVNCFVGSNGAGKTNVLDAMHYLSFCKSYFGTTDSQNVNHDQPFFVIQGRYERNEAEELIYCAVKRGQKKQFRRNKKDYQRLSDHIGLLPLVIIEPMDELLISDGAEERRRYTDSVISQCDKQYLERLITYNKLLQQRNALLKQMQENPMADLSLLDVFDLQMAECGTFISQRRAAFVEWLRPVMSDFYNRLSSSAEAVDMQYVTCLQRYDLYQGLRESRPRDFALGYTSRGIHKDDIDFSLTGYSMRRFGSQGQRKSFVIALKMAQYQYLAQHNDIQPILLLDDIFDKLDARRGENLISMLASDSFGQIFLTDTNRARLMAVLEKTRKDYRIFTVASGEIRLDDKANEQNVSEEGHI